MIYKLPLPSRHPGDASIAVWSDSAATTAGSESTEKSKREDTARRVVVVGGGWGGGSGIESDLQVIVPSGRHETDVMKKERNIV